MDKAIDETDHELLRILELDSHMRLHAIAKKLGMPPSTVHHRIQRLEREGFISGWTIRKDNALLGLKMKAHVLVVVDVASLTALKRTQKDIARDIRALEGVEGVDIITGDADLLVTVRTKDMEGFQAFLLERLQSIKGITKTKTMIVVSES